MTGRELIEEIKKHPNIDLPICVSIDYHSRYPERRVYTTDFLEMIDNDQTEITLLFEGYSNQEYR